jgi:hypothetical protein
MTFEVVHTKWVSVLVRTQSSSSMEGDWGSFRLLPNVSSSYLLHHSDRWALLQTCKCTQTSTWQNPGLYAADGRMSLKLTTQLRAHWVWMIWARRGRHTKKRTSPETKQNNLPVPGYEKCQNVIRKTSVQNQRTWEGLIYHDYWLTWTHRVHSHQPSCFVARFPII